MKTLVSSLVLLFCCCYVQAQILGMFGKDVDYVKQQMGKQTDFEFEDQRVVKFNNVITSAVIYKTNYGPLYIFYFPMELGLIIGPCILQSVYQHIALYETEHAALKEKYEEVKPDLFKSKDGMTIRLIKRGEGNMGLEMVVVKPD